MKLLSMSAVIGALALGGCVASTDDQRPDARPSSQEANELADVGIDSATASQRVSRVAQNNVVDTGLAAGMTSSFGGPGLVAGVLGVLTGPGAGLAGDPNIIITLPAGANAATYEARYAQTLYRVIGRNLEAEGYRRASLQKAPTAVTFVKGDCGLDRNGYFQKSCSLSFNANIFKPQQGGSGNTHIVSLLVSDSTLVPDYASLARRVVDQHPSELSLYLPPQRVSGQMTGPRLYQAGKETAL